MTEGGQVLLGVLGALCLRLKHPLDVLLSLFSQTQVYTRPNVQSAFCCMVLLPPSNIFLLSRSRTLDEAGPQVVSHSIKVSTFWHLHFAGAWDFQKQPYLSGYICYQGKSRRNQERGGSVICMKVVPYFLVYARGFCP